MPALTAEQASATIRQHGKTVVPRAEWDELCATAAAGIAAQANLDRDYAALFDGRRT